MLGGLFSIFTSGAGPFLGIALAGMTVTAGVQTARIEGVPLVGGGLKAQVSELRDSIENPSTGYIVRLHIAEDNARTYKRGLETCNASIDALGAAGKTATDRANAALATVRMATEDLNREVALIRHAESDGDHCSSADRLILRSLK